MPFLTIKTNATTVNRDIVEKAAALVAEQLHKPVRYVVVSVESNRFMAFNGSMDVKGVLMDMKSIGFGNKEALAKALTDFAVNNFNVEEKFVNINFVDMPGQEVAIAGSLLG